uniref:Putative secreted protein n=1 Tax=Ixodes ricinus TaxID=34613 RepID=A0A090XCV9_IXORI
MEVSIILSILLAFIGGISCSEASESNGTNPTAKFYERIQSFPIVLYQCYRNGTVLETGACHYYFGAVGMELLETAIVLRPLFGKFKNGTARSSKKVNFSNLLQSGVQDCICKG